MKRMDLFRVTGSTEQLFGIKDYRLIGGKADNMRAMDLYNANGLVMTVLPDRGMDIASLSYAGKNISFLSKTGLVSSEYFTENKTSGFMKNFFAGFMTTCGLTYMGASCIDEGEELGVHGQISNIPASMVSPNINWNDNNTTLSISGQIKQAQVFKENMQLHRTITMDAYINDIKIKDEITNCSFTQEPFMILYHINFGYPFLDSNCELVMPSKSVIARDEIALAGYDQWRQITDPIDDFEEQVFFHEMKPSEDGRVSYMVINHKLNIGVKVSYPKEQLKHFTQWKCMRSGEYVLGMEPGNCHVKGRDIARKEGTLEYLEPGEKRDIEIRLHIYETPEEIELARKEIEDL